MVGRGTLAASMIRLPGAIEASTAKGLRCQRHASRQTGQAYSSNSRGPLVICLVREAEDSILSVR